MNIYIDLKDVKKMNQLTPMPRELYPTIYKGFEKNGVQDIYKFSLLNTNTYNIVAEQLKEMKNFYDVLLKNFHGGFKRNPIDPNTIAVFQGSFKDSNLELIRNFEEKNDFDIEIKLKRGKHIVLPKKRTKEQREKNITPIDVIGSRRIELLNRKTKPENENLNKVVRFYNKQQVDKIKKLKKEYIESRTTKL